MGGLGSGRRSWRLGVDECRALDLGELCDQGRWHTQAHGEVVWRARYDGATLARLSYAITGAATCQQRVVSQLSLRSPRRWPCR